MFTDSGNAGYLGGSGARLPPLCGARIEAIVGNDLSLRATAKDVKCHVVVKAKKRRPSIPNVDEVTDDKLCSHGVMGEGELRTNRAYECQCNSIN